MPRPPLHDLEHSPNFEQVGSKRRLAECQHTRQESAVLKTITDLPPQLIALVLALRLSLSRPQLRHVSQVADALITAQGSKTLSALYRNIVGDRCLKAAADTFREAPCSAPVVELVLIQLLVYQVDLISTHGQVM
jgi:hypothetical protein